MTTIPVYHLDAFSDRVFAGNPAAVCPLEEWLPDRTLQAIAVENNLSETAYFVRRDGGEYDLRWFTPAVEVDLCGHATLAAGHVVLTRLDGDRDAVTFHSRSGPLTVARDGDRLAMDFPARPPEPGSGIDAADLAAALGAEPVEVLSARDTLAVFDSENEVRDLRPDMGGIARLDTFAVIATAPGDAVDFVSRFFAPSQGIPEDPVTGSAHCTLAPYWAGRIGRTALAAEQVSPRGGAVWCRLEGDRVRLAGHVSEYMEGTITL